MRPLVNFLHCFLQFYKPQSVQEQSQAKLNKHPYSPTQTQSTIIFPMMYTPHIPVPPSSGRSYQKNAAFMPLRQAWQQRFPWAFPLREAASNPWSRGTELPHSLLAVVKTLSQGGITQEKGKPNIPEKWMGWYIPEHALSKVWRLKTDTGYWLHSVYIFNFFCHTYKKAAFFRTCLF